MAFRINHSHVVAASDAGFSALPDGTATCLHCRRPVGHQPRDSLAMVPVAGESNGNPRALYAASCPMCSTAHPADQLLADWAKGDAADEFGADRRQRRRGAERRLRGSGPVLARQGGERAFRGRNRAGPIGWMRSIGCAAILLLGGAEAHATIITVGLGGGFNYTTIGVAVARADADTDPTHSYTITVAPGTYTNDTMTVSRSMTIQATTPGSVILNETVNLPNQKGIILSRGLNTQLTVSGLTFQGARIADSLGGNGAGIRDQNSGPNASLTVLNSRFINDQMGILQGNDSGEVITVSGSEFINNGNPNSAVFGHAIYINTAESLTVDSSEFCGQLIGHDVKSRAAATTVRNSVMYEGALDPNIPTCRAGTASFSIDAPNGGLVNLTGDKLYQGSLSQNARMVDYGEEGLISANNAFTISNTLFSSTKGSTIGIYDPRCVPVGLTGDTFIGVATQVSPAACAVSSLASTPTLVAAADLTADPAAVPEPGSVLILGAALTILRLLKRPNGRGTAAS